MSIAAKLWRLLTPLERRGAVLLVGLMIIGMAFETLGVGLVIPALALMTQPDLIERYPAVRSWVALMGNPGPGGVVVAGMLTLVMAYFLKAVFLAFLAWRQMKYVYSLQSELSQRLFEGYVRQSYTFHLERNSAQLIRNVLTEVNLLSQNGMLQGLTLLTELLVVVGIFALLLYVEPIGALLAVLTLGVAGGGFYLLIRAPMLRWGQARQLHEGMRIQHLQQGLAGVKDVKVLGREKEFIGQYRMHTEAAARVGHRQQAFQQFPRFALELLAVIALAVLVVVMVARDRPVAVFLPTIGLFAAAAFRIMPSVNRILAAVQVVRFSMPVVSLLHTEFEGLDVRREQKSGPVVPIPFRESLTLGDVHFSYANTPAPAVAGVNLSIRAGQTVGFIGGSGAGKSTLVDLVLGLLAPSRGTIRVDGEDVQTNLRGWQSQIGYVPQSIYLTDDTLRRNIAFGIADENIDEAAVRRALRAAQLEQFIAGLPLGLDTTVGERGVRLSGGQLQRIGIARALYHDPAVLVLDEATSALDTSTERSVMDAVRALHGSKTVIIVAHRLSTVEHCDQLYRLESGRVVETGQPAGIITRVSAAK